MTQGRQSHQGKSLSSGNGAGKTVSVVRMIQGKSLSSGDDAVLAVSAVGMTQWWQSQQRE